MAKTNLQEVPGLGFDYTNTPDTPIAEQLFIPCLQESISFDALFGFFSSESLIAIVPGLDSLFSHGGRIRLAICAFLRQEDVAAIEEGYEEKVRASFSDAEKRLFQELRKAAEDSPNSVALLREMIAADRLEIIAVGPYQSSGLMHEKTGIFEDSSGNCVLFSGSSNLTPNAITDIRGFWNYEGLKVFRSWVGGEDKYCLNDRKKIERIFAGDDPWLRRKEISVTVKEYIDGMPEVSSCHKSVATSREDSSLVVKEEAALGGLYDYQQAAVDKWFEMGCRGFFMMATGTGKTRTALAAVKEYWEKKRNAVVVIAIPLLALADQWEREVERWLGVHPIVCNSKNAEWKEEVTRALSGRRFRPKDSRTVLIVTYNSKTRGKLESILRNYPHEKCLFLADEAHHVDPEWLESATFFGPCIGLSATPGTGMPGDDIGPRIIRDFGGLTIDLPLEEALKKGVLAPYDYHPLYCHSNEEEEGRYRYYTKLIAAALQDEGSKKADDVARLIRQRSAILANCEDKVRRLDEFLLAIRKEDLDHLIVYCGAGDLYGESLEEARRYIEHVHRRLTSVFPDFVVSPFTSEETKEEREGILRGFQEGSIRAITAIRCLDEGIDLPSIRAALILASGSTLREFIQRRGRILRLSEETGKDHAAIYDVLCLPLGEDSQALARSELRRFYEFARSARNWEGSLKGELERRLRHYGLGTIEDAFLNEGDSFEMEKMEMEGGDEDA